MSKPDLDIPTEFASNGVKTPFDISKVQNGFDRINPDILAGDNLNKFIDDTYKGLNGVLELYDIKANNTLNNLQETQSPNLDGQVVFVVANLVQNLNLNNSSSTPYQMDLSSYLPADNYSYMVMVDANIVSTATSGQYCCLVMSGTLGVGIFIANCRPRSNATVQASGNGILIVDSSRIIRATRQPNYYGTADIHLKWYRRIGTNA